MSERRGFWARSAAAAALLGVVAAGPASAAVSMTASPTTSVSWTLASEGTNTRSGGTLTVDATGPYVVTVTADTLRLTEHDGSAYVTGGKSLAAPLNVIALRTGGTAAVPGSGTTAVVGTSSTLATGSGLGTDTYALTLSQTTAMTDAALPAGRTYRIVLTYTASPAL